MGGLDDDGFPVDPTDLSLPSEPPMPLQRWGCGCMASLSARDCQAAACGLGCSIMPAFLSDADGKWKHGTVLTGPNKTGGQTLRLSLLPTGRSLAAGPFMLSRVAVLLDVGVGGGVSAGDNCSCAGSGGSWTRSGSVLGSGSVSALYAFFSCCCSALCSAEPSCIHCGSRHRQWSLGIWHGKMSCQRCGTALCHGSERVASQTVQSWLSDDQLARATHSVRRAVQAPAAGMLGASLNIHARHRITELRCAGQQRGCTCSARCVCFSAKS